MELEVLKKNCFISYLNDQCQCVSINSFYSNCRQKYGTPEGSILEPFLLIIYINDLSLDTKNSKTFNFDNTCILNTEDSIKEIKKSVYKNLLKLFLQWLNTKKILINIAKTEVVIFRWKGNLFDTDLQLKLSGKNLQISSFVEYFGFFR